MQASEANAVDNEAIHKLVKAARSLGKQQLTILASLHRVRPQAKGETCTLQFCSLALRSVVVVIVHRVGDVPAWRAMRQAVAVVLAVVPRRSMAVRRPTLWRQRVAWTCTCMAPLVATAAGTVGAVCGVVQVCLSIAVRRRVIDVSACTAWVSLAGGKSRGGAHSSRGE